MVGTVVVTVRPQREVCAAFAESRETTMKLRGLLGLTLAGAIMCWASIGATKSAACAKAEREVVSAQRAFAQASQNADVKAAGYHRCVESKGRARCKREQQALRAAQKAKRDAHAAYSFAIEKAKQVCGG